MSFNFFKFGTAALQGFGAYQQKRSAFFQAATYASNQYAAAANAERAASLAKEAAYQRQIEADIARQKELQAQREQVFQASLLRNEQHLSNNMWTRTLKDAMKQNPLAEIVSYYDQLDEQG